MEERNELIKELFELHKLLADKGEISIGYGFSENYERLEAKVKKLTIPVVVGRSEQLCEVCDNDGVFETSDGFIADCPRCN